MFHPGGERAHRPSGGQGSPANTLNNSCCIIYLPRDLLGEGRGEASRDGMGGESRSWPGKEGKGMEQKGKGLRKKRMAGHGRAGPRRKSKRSLPDLVQFVFKDRIIIRIIPR